MSELYTGLALADLIYNSCSKEHLHRAIDLLFAVHKDSYYHLQSSLSDYPTYSPVYDGLRYDLKYLREDKRCLITWPLSGREESEIVLYLVVITEEQPQVELGWYNYGEFEIDITLPCVRVVSESYFFHMPEQEEKAIRVTSQTSIKDIFYVLGHR